MTEMRELLKEIYPLRLAPVSADTDRAIERLHREIGGTIHEYPSGRDVNGWVVPQKWEVKRAQIRRDGRLIYDGTAHPLGVIGYSSSFHGTVSLDELKRHVYYHKQLHDAIVYHYKLYYRNWESDWGFCMPWNLLKTLKPGDYDIELETVHEPGTMKVLEAVAQGRSNETITFIAHDCHAAQANDDIAGVVAGVELIRRLRDMDTHYTYRLLVGPEQFSSVCFLADLPPEQRTRCRYGIYLETLGHDNRFALQESFNSDSEIDHAARHFLEIRHPESYIAPFRQVIGNDETVWEAPGYEIPTISFSRANPVTDGLPYPEYHTEYDNEDIIRQDKLEDAVEAVLGILRILEDNRVATRNFEGLIALSNPRYDLYLDAPADPAFSLDIPDLQRRWFGFLVRAMRYFDGSTTVLEMARRHGLPFEEVLEYLRRFEKKGLIDLHPVARRSAGVGNNGFKHRRPAGVQT
ncbi:DUF4910 domain-containing protein [bacterium]|nr:DUF4910 domain-containing protein [bacterium]